VPSIVLGPIKIVSVSGGTVLFGDTFFIAPKSASKAFEGSGCGVTGDFSATYNLLSNTNTIDADAVDSNTTSVV
jgi:spore germination protein PF